MTVVRWSMWKMVCSQIWFSGSVFIFPVGLSRWRSPAPMAQTTWMCVSICRLQFPPRLPVWPCRGDCEICVLQVYHAGPWLFYRPSSTFFSLERGFAMQIVTAGVFWSRWTTVGRCLYKILDLNKFSPLWWRPRGGNKFCSWHAVSGISENRTSALTRI